MRNKLLATLMTLTLISLVPGISQAATPKVGAKCTKLNSTSGTLICKKVGGKPVWQKKVVVKATPASDPTQHPKPTLPSLCQPMNAYKCGLAASWLN